MLITKILLDKGAEIDAGDKVFPFPFFKMLGAFHCKNKGLNDLTIKWTPLHKACDKNSTIVAKLLIERGANINAKDKIS